MTIKKLALFTFICTLAVLALPAISSAGTAPDPNTHDTWLGTTGGIRYATDSAAYDPTNNNFIDVYAGCGAPNWHLFGGGSLAAGGVAKSFDEADRPDDYLDADTNLDDGWLANGKGTIPAKLHAYTACMKHAASYPFHIVANDSSGSRTASIACPGTQRVTQGSMFIATSNSWITSTYPYDGPDMDSIPDDGWRGSVFDTAGGIGGFSDYAVCSKGLKLHYLKSSTTNVKVKSAATIKVPCPAEQHVIGGGERLTGSQSAGRLIGSFPYDGPDNDKIPDDGWKAKVYNLDGSAKQLTGWAICLG
jgi:hypothetical protein